MRTLARLALPLVAGHAGNQLMSFVDTAMVGRLGSSALAGVGIANGLFGSITLFGLGCVLGMDAPVSQAVGSGDPARARRILWQGIYVALLVGVPLSLLLALTPEILGPAGVAPDIIATARVYTWGRVPNVIPFLLFAATRSYLQAVHVTRPIVIAMVVANIVNFLGNALLMFGDRALARVGLPGIGLPELGVVGSALSSSFASLLSFGVLSLAIAGVAAVPDPSRRRLDRALVKTVLGLGTPSGLTILAEVGIFTIVGILAGRLGAGASSGHMVALTLASFTFTVALGISAATSVLVGHAVGRADHRGARRAGLLGLVATAAFMATSLATFLLFPHALARILTNDPEVIAAALPLIGIAAIFQLSDGTQVTAAGALRGAGDARVPLVVNLAGYYLVGLPVAVALGMGAAMGARGLWWGLVAGLTAVAIALTVRFLVVTSRPITRV
jgi:MATE family multidrug resistance protein